MFSFFLQANDPFLVLGSAVENDLLDRMNWPDTLGHTREKKILYALSVIRGLWGLIISGNTFLFLFLTAIAIATAICFAFAVLQVTLSWRYLLLFLNLTARWRSLYSLLSFFVFAEFCWDYWALLSLLRLFVFWCWVWVLYKKWDFEFAWKV